jgi:hypothetical protein
MESSVVTFDIPVRLDGGASYLKRKATVRSYYNTDCHGDLKCNAPEISASLLAEPEVIIHLCRQDGGGTISFNELADEIRNNSWCMTFWFKDSEQNRSVPVSEVGHWSIANDPLILLRMHLFRIPASQYSDRYGISGPYDVHIVRDDEDSIMRVDFNLKLHYCHKVTGQYRSKEVVIFHRVERITDYINDRTKLGYQPLFSKLPMVYGSPLPVMQACYENYSLVHQEPEHLTNTVSSTEI